MVCENIFKTFYIVRLGLLVVGRQVECFVVAQLWQHCRQFDVIVVVL